MHGGREGLEKGLGQNQRNRQKKESNDELNPGLGNGRGILIAVKDLVLSRGRLISVEEIRRVVRCCRNADAMGWIASIFSRGSIVVLTLA